MKGKLMRTGPNFILASAPSDLITPGSDTSIYYLIKEIIISTVDGGTDYITLWFGNVGETVAGTEIVASAQMAGGTTKYIYFPKGLYLSNGKSIVGQTDNSDTNTTIIFVYEIVAATTVNTIYAGPVQVGTAAVDIMPGEEVTPVRIIRQIIITPRANNNFGLYISASSAVTTFGTELITPLPLINQTFPTMLYYPAGLKLLPTEWLVGVSDIDTSVAVTVIYENWVDDVP